jgi:hypothetical protein
MNRKGHFRTAVLTNAAQVIFTGSRPVFGVRLVGGAAAEVVIFRRSGAGAEYFRVPLAIGEKYQDDIEWDARDGLEVLTADAAGDVQAATHFFEP